MHTKGRIKPGWPEGGSVGESESTGQAHIASMYAYLKAHGNRLLPTRGRLVCSCHAAWWIVIIFVVTMKGRRNG